MPQTSLVGQLTPLNPGYLQALHGAAAVAGIYGSDASCAAPQAQGMLYGVPVRQSNMLAFIDVFWVLGVVCFAMIPLMFFIKSAPRHSAAASLLLRMPRA